MLGGTIGILVGTIAGLSRVGEEVVDAPLQALRVVPSLALTSLFIIWFGIGETSKVGLIALGAFFPLYLNTFGGIRTVDLRLVEGARIFGLGRFALATKVMLPGALPQVLIGLRQSIGVAWLTLVVVEQTNAPTGVGVAHHRRPGVHAHRHRRRGPAPLCRARACSPTGRASAGEADPRLARLLRGPVMRPESPAVPQVAGRPTRVGRRPVVDGIRREFGGRVVLDDVSLRIGAGEFVALLGASGSGKTTILRAVAGLDQQVTGRMTVPENLAVVFQEHRLLPWPGPCAT